MTADRSVIVTPPTTDKKEDLHLFLSQFEHYAELHNLEERAAVSTLIVSLREDEARVALSLPRGSTLRDITAALRTTFDSLTTPMSASLKFKNALRHKEESARSYVVRLRKLARKAFPDYDDVAMEKRILEQFQDGQPLFIKQMMALHEFRSIDECSVAVQRYEDKTTVYGLPKDGLF